MSGEIVELDALLRRAFLRCAEDIRKDQWYGKERDCVQRFAMGYLVDACGTHHFLQHPTQIGIEMPVAKPPDVGKRRSAPKDLVIWHNKWPKVWDAQWNPAMTPIAVIEWKVSRGKKGGKKKDHDEKWLRSFTTSKPSSVGYSVMLRFDDARDLCSLHVSRFFGGKHDQDGLWPSFAGSRSRLATFRIGRRSPA